MHAHQSRSKPSRTTHSKSYIPSIHTYTSTQIHTSIQTYAIHSTYFHLCRHVHVPIHSSLSSHVPHTHIVIHYTHTYIIHTEKTHFPRLYIPHIHTYIHIQLYIHKHSTLWPIHYTLIHIRTKLNYTHTQTHYIRVHYHQHTHSVKHKVKHALIQVHPHLHTLTFMLFCEVTHAHIHTQIVCRTSHINMPHHFLTHQNACTHTHTHTHTHITDVCVCSLVCEQNVM